MKRLLVLIASVLSGCGSDGAASLPAGVEIHGLVAEDIRAVQITVLANATSYLCSDFVKTCLKDKIADKTLVPIRGAAGKEVRALRVELSTHKLLGEGETFTVTIEPGTEYMVVAEVLSKQGRLLASGCEVRQEVAEGDNAPLVIRAMPILPEPTCDPFIE